MAFDHYAEARRLSAALIMQGLPEWSERIKDAMRYGATGTEIFMHLRSVLRQMIATENLAPDNHLLACLLIEEISKSLS